MLPRSKNASGNRTTVNRLLKRLRSLPLLKLFLLKALCWLVMLNFYMGLQISIVQSEDSFSMMMHHDAYGGWARSSFSKVPSNLHVQAESSNSTTPRIRSNALNQSQNNGMGMITPKLSDGTLKGKAGKTNFARSPSNVHVQVESSSSTTQKVKSDALSQSKNNAMDMITPNLSDGTLKGKERLWNMLQTRNITQVNAAYWASIPTWNTILRNIYKTKSDVDGEDNASPIIHGLETCQKFRAITSSNPSQRRIAPAGMFNSGTNYLNVLLDFNCQNPHRVEKFNGNAKRGHGNEWEVPWGKHSPASSRGKFFKKKKMEYTVDEVLPIILVRNPYGWMKSMCRNPYTAKWKGMHNKETCTRLKAADNDGYNPVGIKYGAGRKDGHHQSLGGLWNDWYGEYFYNINATSSGKKRDAPFPRLIVRFEDLIFSPYEVIEKICTCAGGILGHRKDDKDVGNGTFHYVVRSAKSGSGHGPASQRNGLIDSWLKYGNNDPKDSYSKEDIQIAEEVLDSLMLNTFEYA